MAQPRDTNDVTKDEPRRDSELDRDQPIGRGDEQTAGMEDVDEDEAFDEDEDEEDEEGTEGDEGDTV